MEPDPLVELERVGQAVGGDLPLGRHVADDLGVLERVDLQQRAVERGHELDGGEGLLLVRVETRRISADGREQDAPSARGFGRPDDRYDQGPDQDEREDGEERPVTLHRQSSDSQTSWSFWFV